MTRTEFYENIVDWQELIDFCNNEGLHTCEDVYTRSELDEYINSELPDYICDHDWEDVLETLSAIPMGYEYYRRREYWLEFDCLTYAYFGEYKDRVANEMGETYGWEEDDDGCEDEDSDIFDDLFGFQLQSTRAEAS